MSCEPLTIYECPDCGRYFDRVMIGEHITETGFCGGSLLAVRVFREENVRPLREALDDIAKRCMEVPVGTPCYPLARGVGDLAVDALGRTQREEGR